MFWDVFLLIIDVKSCHSHTVSSNPSARSPLTGLLSKAFQYLNLSCLFWCMMWTLPQAFGPCVSCSMRSAAASWLIHSFIHSLNVQLLDPNLHSPMLKSMWTTSAHNRACLYNTPSKSLFSGCSYNSFHPPGNAVFRNVACRDLCPLSYKAISQIFTVSSESFKHSQHSSSSLRCTLDLRSELCEANSSSST